MRIVFLGTPAPAVPTLEALAVSGHEVVAVVTREDAPVGRRRTLTPSPVAEAAERLGLHLERANRIRPELAARLLELRPDVVVVVAFGGMVREPLLNGPTHGCLNLHFSALPAWRGAAPVQRAIQAGERESAMTIFRLVDELDAGDVLASTPVRFGEWESAGEALARLGREGAPFVVDTLDALVAGRLTARPQTGTPTHAAKLTRADAPLPLTQPAETVRAHLLGVTPEPGATIDLDGQPLKILRASAIAAAELAPGELVLEGRRVLLGTGTEPLVIDEVQPAGRRAMSAADWLRGQPGQRARATVGAPSIEAGS